MTFIRKAAQTGIVCLLLLSILFFLIPMPATTLGRVKLYTRHDDIIGTRPMYFALTDNGSLVGWGGKSVRSFRSTRDGVGSPYVMRRVLANDVKAFSCGAYNGMYIDVDCIC